MSWSWVVSVSWENVERIHDPYHGVYHAVHELSYDSAVDVDTLPWSVEHQHTTDFPKYPIYDVWECPLSRLPPRSASHWNRSCRTSVIVFMSVGPLWVWNLSLSSLLYLQYLSKCLRNSICLGPGLLPHIECVHNSCHGVYHAVHELSYDSAIWFKEKVADGTCVIVKVDSKENNSDIGTKRVSKIIFEYLTHNLIDKSQRTNI